MTSTESNVWKTRDLYEAAFAYAKDAKRFQGLEPDGRDFLFCFGDSDGRYQEWSDMYFSGEAVVNAKAYTDAIKTCKDLIFSRLRERQRRVGR
jgi:hypothetical protein